MNGQASEGEIMGGVDRQALFDGYYEATRAAALSGVPKSTVYQWARNELVVPSVSEYRVKLWSYADLMSLRVTYWLRKPKGSVRATPMSQVRQALAALRDADLPLWDPTTRDCPVVVDHSGRVLMRHELGGLADSFGRRPLSEDLLDPVRPFGEAGLHGPDLVRPRPHLRIVPGKVGGEPHLEHSRLTSLALAALARRFPVAQIIEMYPHESSIGIREAIDLEQEIAPAA